MNITHSLEISNHPLHKTNAV